MLFSGDELKHKKFFQTQDNPSPIEKRGNVRDVLSNAALTTMAACAVGWVIMSMRHSRFDYIKVMTAFSGQTVASTSWYPTTSTLSTRLGSIRRREKPRERVSWQPKGCSTTYTRGCPTRGSASCLSTKCRRMWWLWRGIVPTTTGLSSLSYLRLSIRLSNISSQYHLLHTMIDYQLGLSYDDVFAGH